MDLAQEEVYAFVFRPLNGAEAYLSGFTGDCKDTNGYFAGEKSARGNLSVGNSHQLADITVWFSPCKGTSSNPAANA